HVVWCVSQPTVRVMNVHESGLSPDMLPDTKVSVRELFGLDQDLTVPAFNMRTDYVPTIDNAYRFNPETTLAILAGFAHNRRVMICGYHGTGKSTHIEQVAARLNWPCIRVNLDSHISRIDLVGKDAIVRRDATAASTWWARTPSSCGTARRGRNSARGCCPGRCRTRRRWCSTNTTPA